MRKSEISAALEKANYVVDILLDLQNQMQTGQIDETNWNVNEEFLMLYARENVNAAHAFLSKIAPKRIFYFDTVTRKVVPVQ